MSELTNIEMDRAMRSNNAEYNGRFYVGVHSTGIYCLPSCPARLPLPKNVSFFDTREDALAVGLRGCKRCKADKYPDTLPIWLKKLIKYLRSHPSERLSESDLMNIAGVEISTIRRHFKSTVAVTPLAFHRRLRLNHARKLIESGSGYLLAAHESGWESSSGFCAAFKQQFGRPPGEFYER